MKKLLPILAVVLLLVMAGCGGDSDTEEPTSTPEATETQPAETATVPSDQETTPEPTVAPEPEPTTEAPPTVEPSPEPTVAPEPSPTAETPASGPVEEALDDVMADLVLAFGNVDGEWQGYSGPNTSSLATLENGSVYYWYASEDSMLPNSSIVLSAGWNLKLWMSDTAPVATALEGYEGAIPFVIFHDDQTMQSSLYESSAVAPLTEIIAGQTYNTFSVAEGNVVPDMSTIP